MPFNLKQCHYLVTLADCNNFHQAARTLFITQPTLSIAMKKLEQEMGQPLFQKQGRKAQLTPAGRLALSYARKMLQLDRELARELKALRQNSQRDLHIGTYLLFSTLLMPPLLAAIHKSHLPVDLKLHHRHGFELKDALRRGEFDLILCIQDKPDPGFSCVRLKQATLLAILLPDNPCCQQARPLEGLSWPYLPPAALSGETLFLQSPIQQIRLQEDRLLEQGLKPAACKEIASIETALGLAAEGLGISFTMSCYVKALHPAHPVRYFATGNLQEAPWLTLYYRKELKGDPVLETLIHLLREIVQNIL